MPSEITNLTREIVALWRRFDWLPEWAVIALVLLVFVGGGWLTHKIAFAILRRLVKDKDVFWRGVVERARLKLRILIIIIGVGIGVTVSPMDPGPSADIRDVLVFLFILTLGWLASGVLDMWSVMHLKRYNVAVEDNLLARKHLTQTRILQRVAKVILFIVTVGLALMTISGFRQWGVSLLASAGVLGIIAGLALQPILTNMVAGIQIALTQPIRIDDAVIVEGEWGNVEEITSTYVVVKIWDWRRMVLPLSYFITTPFQNWTRENARLIGSAFFYVDYEAPIDRLRAAFEGIVRASRHWDGDVQVMQVTDITERVLQVRCLASARNAGIAFDLRCEIREKLMAFMRDECREALPRDRVEWPQGEGASISPPAPIAPARSPGPA
ncbi:MAG: mechanosensitive ion channel protein MscS [Brevundimonas sp.]|uniref:Mechanosensitive ion channel family protein n=1 Tax=Brevundimonas albigilva TaxID=1312364 RepID=A0ABY4SLH9_9CAUL|nr:MULTISPECIES: mechanosensitive ion channel family protein [Brevundimonas]PZU53650.1 MAG: mechanosensitive ion channel protein MscS [Brevundimonas sp.]UQV17712.1 mechanosensitive ion channel family protein [Brevundimonas albigilva]URI14407.1 mechanosensitive ion channel family protein [Brevundimonas albigilva]